MGDGALKPSFTAAQIAVALGKTPQAVRKALRGVTATGLRIVCGNPADTWTLEALPASIRDKLEGRAREQGFRDVLALLAAPPTRPVAAMPLGRVHPDDIEYARKLRQALQRWLAGQHEPGLSSAEIEARGVADYKQVFGREITPRYWRMLFRRTLDRAGASRDWGRLELYLPNHPREKESARVVSEAIAEQFVELEAFIDALPRPDAPSPADERLLWDLAFQQHLRLTSLGASEKEAARRVRDYLYAQLPFLAPSRDALLKSYRRKLARWKATRGDGQALVDQRADNGGDDFEFPQADLDLVESLIAFKYGEYAPAWREALQSGKLTEETRARYRKAGGKVRVPRKLRERLGERPYILYRLHRHKRKFNSEKAHFTTLDEGLHTMDAVSADDVTLPVWFWHQPSPGKPAIVTRGQCLVFIDLVSRRIIGYTLIPEKNYNALAIYSQCARLFSEKGIPKVLLFERGIWERSRLLAGSTPYSFSEVTFGLRKYGVEMIHAHSPEGKWEVENVMARIQDLMEGERGYCGRDERRDRPDWINRQLAAVQAQKAHPGEYFYSFAEWNARLGEIIEQYNRTPQHGKMGGKTPDEVYYERWNAEDPPMRPGPELQMLLAHAEFEKVVQLSGITLLGRFKYFGPELKDLVGQRVRVFFNPELPESIIVTDMKKRNPVCVPMHAGVPRLEMITDPGGGRLAQACERREAQASGVRARYNVLKDKYAMPYRRNLVEVQTAEFVQELGRQREANRREVQHGAEVRSRARKLGIPAVLVGPEEEEARRALQQLEEAEREHRASQERQAGPQDGEDSTPEEADVL